MAVGKCLFFFFSFFYPVGLLYAQGSISDRADIGYILKLVGQLLIGYCHGAQVPVANSHLSLGFIVKNRGLAKDLTVQLPNMTHFTFYTPCKSFFFFLNLRLCFSSLIV